MKLLIKIPGKDDQEIQFLQKKLFVGRSSNCDIQIAEQGISRKHLQIELKGGKVYVTDLGSSNGTELGETKLDANKEVEFNQFFPIKVGKDVEISVLPSDNTFVGDVFSNTSTGTTSVDLAAGEDLKSEKSDKRTTKATGRRKTDIGPPKKKGPSPVIVGLFLITAALAAVYFLKPELLAPLLNK
ncbi:MAG: FHA domain-containing protein [Bacteriovoracaceae bacterium]|jgi:pSer/pThr/pTyr-binding forkhead associated (FHA) protein|nr:FHA domain-containing protein [Bacteriovoracaceae bacterium]